ncbi:MAG: hypothetical protein KF842_02235 [Caulobacter sp.]|nr:hypothetical protein [Caulobacter sp.]
MTVADLNNAPPAGETIADAAAALMRRGLNVFDRLAEGQPDHAAALADMKLALEAVAEALERGPFGDAIRIERGEVLQDLAPDGTERRNSNAEVAHMLLRDSANLFRNAAAGDPRMRPELTHVAALFEGMANDLELAPGGVLGPELEQLRPYLGAARDISPVPLPVPDMEATRRLFDNPRFAKIAHRVFEIAVGRDLSTVAEQPRLVWARRLAAVWVERHGPMPEPLSADEQSAIAFAVQHPRGPWAMSPIVAGDWRDATPDDAAVLLGMISEICRVGPAKVPLALASYCDRVRTRPLACYGGVLLVEAQGYTTGGQPGLIQAIIHDERIILADGGSTDIHNLNDLVGPQLETPEARRDYFLLFLNWVRDSGGSRFQPIETAAALADRLDGDPAIVETLKDSLTPVMEIVAENPPEWTLDARLCVDTGLWDSIFTLAADGQVEMIDEQVIAEGLPVRREVQEGWLVRLAEPPAVEGDRE